jgi:hypothetical protein
MRVGRAAGRGAFKGAALIGAFAIIVATWWWDASLLTAAADANLQLIDGWMFIASGSTVSAPQRRTGRTKSGSSVLIG